MRHISDSLWSWCRESPGVTCCNGTVYWLLYIISWVEILHSSVLFFFSLLQYSTVSESKAVVLNFLSHGHPFHIQQSVMPCRLCTTSRIIVCRKINIPKVGIHQFVIQIPSLSPPRVFPHWLGTPNLKIFVSTAKNCTEFEVQESTGFFLKWKFTEILTLYEKTFTL